MAPSATNGTNGTNGIHSTDKIQFDTYHNVINGKLTSTSKTRHGINPATKQPNYEVPYSTQQDVDEAVDAARAAFKTWSRTSVEERREKIMAFAEALRGYSEEFAKLLTTEQGKPLAFGRVEADGAVRWLTSIGGLDLPDEILEDSEERQIICRHTPIGVVAAIVPWNYPFLLATGKLAGALITGNTIIIKPSPFTPYCGLKAAEIAQSFFPPGVVQALSGGDDLGPMLTEHPGIDKISFTGSTATGKKVMASASKTLKRVTLELGGKDPSIICKSANVAEMAPQIATAAFFNSGQICVASKRIYIHKDIYEEFRDAMISHVKTLKVGDGMVEGTFLGPVQNAMQYERVQGFFQDIEKEGQKVAFGGITPDSNGYFINPTIIDNPKEDSRIVLEEPFGPIVPILPWTDEEDVIARANDTRMGLGASVWTTDLAEGERIAKRLEAGSVWINKHLDLNPLAPFGGHKESGIGSEWGRDGLRSYTNTQCLFMPKNA